MSDDRPWRQQIQQSSFRGVDFEIDTATMQFGRRGPIHQFPFKDVPFAEDVGRQARVFRVNAYVDGDNYLDRRDALLKAIENFDVPGTLIMPTFGTIRVKPSADSTVTYNNRIGGIETFSLIFTEAGSQEFPKATTNTKETSKIRADEVANTVKGEGADNINFEQKLPDSTEGVNDPDSFADQSIKIIEAFNESVFDAVETGIQISDKVDEFTRKFRNFRADARTLILDPLSLLNATDTIYSDLREVYNAASDFPGAFDAFRDIFNSEVDDIAKVIDTIDPVRIQQDKNNQALKDGNRNLLLKEMSIITADETFISTDQVRRRRSEILDLFEIQIENAGDNFDRCQRDALVDLRSAVVADLNSKIGGLPDEVIITLGDVTPADALAYKLYADAFRAEEIADTNKIINPNFLPPATPLNVLSA